MRIDIGGLAVDLLADPHLGRPFVHGVPLHRRGEREASVRRDFHRALLPHGGIERSDGQAGPQSAAEADVHICLGDLFDRWFVPYHVVFDAIVTYLAAATRSPETRFIVIGGNHDISRDLEKKGALDLFELAVAGTPNIKVVRHEAFHTELAGVTAGFFPWHPTLAAEQLVDRPLDVAFGHYDTMFGEANMAPTAKLAEMGCHTLHTGHVHKPEKFERDGVEVNVVGALQPLAHGEDGGEMYLTLRPDEIDGRDLTNSCVRVLLEPGEVFDRRVDCLQLSFKRTRAGTDDLQVSIGAFDIRALFAEAFEAEAVPAAIRAQLIEKFEEQRVKE